MKINRLILGPVSTNCYVFCDKNSGSAAVIDPAYNPEAISKAAEENGCKIEKIILTHGHGDHIGGLAGLLKMAPGAKLYSHKEGIKVLGDEKINLSTEIGGKTETFVPDSALDDGDVIPFGDSSFEVIYTPGHTIDSICLKYDGMIFCGDTVFKFSIGRTDLPTGNQVQEIQSIKSKLMCFDDDMTLYPGHGEATTIGDERRYNPFLQN